MPSQPHRPEWLPEWDDHPFPARLPEPAGPIVVATDGAPDADAAVRLALALAGRTNADVRVLSVVESPALLEVQARLSEGHADRIVNDRRSERERQVRAQLARTVGLERPWPLEVAVGATDELIDRAARAHDARLIVVGRGRHSLMDRVSGGETITRIIGRCAVPVYAAEPGSDALPRRIVVAMDFSRYAVAAVQVALRYASPAAAVTLVHAWSRLDLVASAARSYEQAIPAMCAAAARHLRDVANVDVETAMLEGTSPADVVADYADAARADLVVSASHGHGLLTRLALGSVAAGLLRRAPCSFFCLPARAIDAGAAAWTAAAARGRASP